MRLLPPSKLGALDSSDRLRGVVDRSGVVSSVTTLRLRRRVLGFSSSVVDSDVSDLDDWPDFSDLDEDDSLLIRDRLKRRLERGVLSTAGVSSLDAPDGNLGIAGESSGLGVSGVVVTSGLAELSGLGLSDGTAGDEDSGLIAVVGIGFGLLTLLTAPHTNPIAANVPTSPTETGLSIFRQPLLPMLVVTAELDTKAFFLWFDANTC